MPLRIQKMLQDPLMVITIAVIIVTGMFPYSTLAIKCYSCEGSACKPIKGGIKTVDCKQSYCDKITTEDGRLVKLQCSPSDKVAKCIMSEFPRGCYTSNDKNQDKLINCKTGSEVNSGGIKPDIDENYDEVSSNYATPGISICSCKTDLCNWKFRGQGRKREVKEEEEVKQNDGVTKEKDQTGSNDDGKGEAGAENEMVNKQANIEVFGGVDADNQNQNDGGRQFRNKQKPKGGYTARKCYHCDSINDRDCDDDPKKTKFVRKNETNLPCKYCLKRSSSDDVIIRKCTSAPFADCISKQFGDDSCTKSADAATVEQVDQCVKENNGKEGTYVKAGDLFCICKSDLCNSSERIHSHLNSPFMYKLAFGVLYWIAN